MLVSFLCRFDDTISVQREGREITSAVLEEVGFEGNGTAVQVGVVLQNAAAIDEHRVGRIQMTCRQPVCIVSGYLDFRKNRVDTFSGVL